MSEKWINKQKMIGTEFDDKNIWFRQSKVCMTEKRGNSKQFHMRKKKKNKSKSNWEWKEK